MRVDRDRGVRLRALRAVRLTHRADHTLRRIPDLATDDWVLKGLMVIGQQFSDWVLGKHHGPLPAELSLHVRLHGKYSAWHLR